MRPVRIPFEGHPGWNSQFRFDVSSIGRPHRVQPSRPQCPVILRTSPAPRARSRPDARSEADAPPLRAARGRAFALACLQRPEVRPDPQAYRSALRARASMRCSMHCRSFPPYAGSCCAPLIVGSLAGQSARFQIPILQWQWLIAHLGCHSPTSKTKEQVKLQFGRSVLFAPSQPWRNRCDRPKPFDRDYRFSLTPCPHRPRRRSPTPKRMAHHHSGGPKTITRARKIRALSRKIRTSDSHHYSGGPREPHQHQAVIVVGTQYSLTRACVAGWLLHFPPSNRLGSANRLLTDEAHERPGPVRTEQHDCKGLRLPTFHAGRSDWHAWHGDAFCVRSL